MDQATAPSQGRSWRQASLTSIVSQPPLTQKPPAGAHRYPEGFSLQNRMAGGYLLSVLRSSACHVACQGLDGPRPTDGLAP